MKRERKRNARSTVRFFETSRERGTSRERERREDDGRLGKKKKTETKKTSLSHSRAMDLNDEDEARWNAAQPSGLGFVPIAHFSRHILIWVYMFTYVLCVREVFIPTAAPRHRIARARRHPSTRTGRAARANGDIHYILTFSRAVSPRRARETPRAGDARAGDIHHVGALSTRTRRPRTFGVDVVRRGDARV